MLARTTWTRAGVVVAALLVVAVAVTGADHRPEPSATSARDASRARPASPVARLPGHTFGSIGVASFNALWHLGPVAAEADWDRITGDPAIDLIGWQESKSTVFGDLYPRYRALGWETWRHPDPDGPISLAVSWRTGTFAFEDVRWHRMHRGGYPRETTHPFPARWVVEISLRHRASGLLVTLLNTHVNQHIETGAQFQDNLNARFARRHLDALADLWGSVTGDVVIGTGDYNFDYRDDSNARPAGGISRQFAGRAVSSYDALGLDGLAPTRNTRWIDYVFLADESVRRRGRGGTAQFVRHRTLAGFNSDHSPFLTRLRLYAPRSMRN